MPASRPRSSLDGDRATRAAPTALTSSADAADAADAVDVSAPAVTRVGFAPIVRVDSPQREIELCATSEAVDSYGTIFDYPASKDAFQRWIGNVREMHERRAVGSRVAVRFDDPARRIYVTVRISRGAQDTWEKILDGTLRGASIGASNVNWERQVRRVAGRTRALDVATHYDLVELSLVDNPSNPDALGISIVRDAVPDLAMLAPLGASAEPSIVEPDLTPLAPAATLVATLATTLAAPSSAGVAGEPADTPDGGDPVERADDGQLLLAVAPVDAAAASVSTARIFSRGHAAHEAAHDDTSAENNGVEASSTPCPPCPTMSENVRDVSADVRPMSARVAGSDGSNVQHSRPLTGRALGPFSDNAEGHPDAGVPARADERPTADLGMTPGGNLRERLHAAARSVLQGCGCPLCQGAIAALGADGDELDPALPAARATDSAHTAALRDAALARALGAGLSASAGRLDRMDDAVRGLTAMLQASVSQMTGTVGHLRSRVQALEAQPMPGGPAVRPVAKTHVLSPDASPVPPDAAEQYRALESLAGRLTDPQAQIAVAAEMIRLRRS